MDKNKKHRAKFAAIVYLRFTKELWDKLTDFKLPGETNPAFVIRILTEYIEIKDKSN